MFDPNKTIIDISPLITPDMPVFPGDTPFSRQVLMDFEKGDNLALSTINTTVHLGSHTDAPYHYHKHGRTIEQQDLHRFLGSAQIIDVTHISNSAITVTELNGINVSCKKVLFKSNSFPHEGPWQNEFAYLSPELITYLSEQGVTTVGIDTPSVDSATSKNLPCHHAIFTHDMTILEGLDLRNVDSNKMYELIALPLKIQGGDASPVRAILIEQ